MDFPSTFSLYLSFTYVRRLQDAMTRCHDQHGVRMLRVKSITTPTPFAPRTTKARLATAQVQCPVVR